MSLFDRFRLPNRGKIQHEPTSSPSTDAQFLQNGGAPQHEPESRLQGSTDTANASPSATYSLPDPRAAYAFGVADGRKQVDPENFTQYLQRSAQEEEIDARLATLQRRETEIQDELSAVRERRESLARLQVEVEHLDASTQQISEEIHQVEHDLEAAQVDYEGVRHLGLLSYIVIYGVASLAFVLADIVITRAIVADALGLTGTRIFGIDEAWYFAIALALIAVLLKPAYDRLVEEPFWEGKRRSFNITIVTASFLSLATLYVLGAFRNVAFKSHTEQNLYRITLADDPAGLLRKLSELQSQVVNNIWGKAAFIISGVLFAIAGAICLGIGLRHLHAFWNLRLPLRRRYKALDKLLRKLRNKHTKKLTERATAQARLRGAEVWLENRSRVDELQGLLASVRTEQDNLLALRSEVRQERLSRLYADGYNMGERLGDHPPVQSPARPPRKRPRPYIAIRRAIRTTLSGINY